MGGEKNVRSCLLRKQPFMWWMIPRLMWPVTFGRSQNPEADRRKTPEHRSPSWQHYLPGAEDGFIFRKKGRQMMITVGKTESRKCRQLDRGGKSGCRKDSWGKVASDWKRWQSLLFLLVKRICQTLLSRDRCCCNHILNYISSSVSRGPSGKNPILYAEWHKYDPLSH